MSRRKKAGEGKKNVLLLKAIFFLGRRGVGKVENYLRGIILYTDFFISQRKVYSFAFCIVVL